MTPALDLDEVRAVITEVTLPPHFYVRSQGALEWQPNCVENISWEIYHGRLLDPAQTRQRQEFEAWNIFWSDAQGRSSEPILSVKLDAGARQLHVTRAIYCYAWEGYHAGDNVYLSRETLKWVRELAGTIVLTEFATPGEVRDELICLVFQAVVGASRLALTSVEAPLPAFSLGELAYVYRPEASGTQPMPTFRHLIGEALQVELNWLEKTKLLEAVLRSIAKSEEREAAGLFVSRWYSLGHDDRQLAALCRSLFNEAALAPYTEFVDRALSFAHLVLRGPRHDENSIDFLSYLLRQTVRHLTAYDLITFHHRGSNYPDALLLETLLSRYAGHISEQPSYFSGLAADDRARQKQERIRRRALRQAWLVRKSYEGLPVPDAPTSPGENSRVLPTPHRRVPDEQILQPALRSKRLFVVPLFKVLPDLQALDALLAQCGADLHEPEELQELGIAIFLDRPFGAFKAPQETDRTLLLSYEAWSRSMAEQRLELAFNEPPFCPTTENLESYREALRRLEVPGVPLKTSTAFQRPGAVALADAAKVANDFVLLRTTRQTVQAFLELFDFTGLGKQFDLNYLDPAKKLLIVSAAATGEAAKGVLLVYDDQMRRRLELQVDPSQGYRSRAGLEYPRAGLRALRIWEPAGNHMREHDLSDARLTIAPRS